MNEFILSLATGLSIGFLGSFHCIGMCGPIALSLPVASVSGGKKYAGIFFYNFGRAITYSALGLLFGFMGNQFRIWGLQQVVSITAGVLILVFIISNFSFSSRIGWLAQLNAWVKLSLARLLNRPKNTFSFLSIGLLNGLLPCGLVYVAIAASLATMNTLNGMLLMFAFGLGTLPVMGAMMAFGHLLSFNFRHRLKRAVPVFVGLMAVILILRGMNLGIPYLSPKLGKTSATVECCHKPS
ncbi:MAG: sulfite exporter TauE/SafE family protein [Saprospiraceae bacterium]|uniref:Sulfite exporter TauE/SafE family protein n=1 Tax=Candidatus Opimibacter skivensis TaxID=2982028 RepID=A0A9D7XRV5_9BACT|nr:sulfite exporter TauE/SafE family protein [Candidatus Opimibacter skivensis]